MDCQKARMWIKLFLESCLKDQDGLEFDEMTPGEMEAIEDAFNHIRECQEKECFLLRLHLNSVIISMEPVDLTVDEEGLLPFSC